MAPDVTLFGHWICPYSVRVSFALAHMEIVHDVVDVPPTAARPPGYVVPAEFVEHSPKGEIPMVCIDGEYRADSIPLLVWLDERFPEVALSKGGSSHQGAAEAQAAWIDSTLFPPMIGIYYGTDPQRIAESSQRLQRGLDELGEQLGLDPWLSGSAPGRAEAVIIPLYVRLEGLSRLGCTAILPPRVAEHRDRCQGLTAWDAVAWSSAQTDEFVGRFEAYRRRVRASSAP